jgi:hydrogenase maturation protease
MTGKTSSEGKSKSWRARLVREIRPAMKISILGAGNAQRGDDAAGLEAVEILTDRLARSPDTGRPIQILKTFEAPENYTGAVRSFGPDLVILVDAAAAGTPPGTIFVVDPASIGADDISTHRIPLSAFVRFLEEDIGCRVLVIGIEPHILDSAPSPSDFHGHQNIDVVYPFLSFRPKKNGAVLVLYLESHEFRRYTQ